MTSDPRALNELLEESQDLQADALRPTSRSARRVDRDGSCNPKMTMWHRISPFTKTIKPL